MRGTKMKPFLCTFSADYLRSRLSYSPETGKFIWLERTDAARPPWWNAKFAHKEAGSINPRGRRTINIDGHLYFSSRLAWLYMTGEWPDSLIDHEDKNPGNDAWRNLRAANHSQNAANRKIHSTNSLKTKGVRKRGPGKYQARISHSGGAESLGIFSTKEAASDAYMTEAKKRFGDFASAS